MLRKHGRVRAQSRGGPLETGRPVRRGVEVEDSGCAKRLWGSRHEFAASRLLFAPSPAGVCCDGAAPDGGYPGRLWPRLRGRRIARQAMPAAIDVIAQNARLHDGYMRMRAAPCRRCQWRSCRAAAEGRGGVADEGQGSGAQGPHLPGVLLDVRHGDERVDVKRVLRQYSGHVVGVHGRLQA